MNKKKRIDEELQRSQYIHIVHIREIKKCGKQSSNE